MKNITVLSISKFYPGIYKLKKGDVVTLIKEPNNKHDKYAIQVCLPDKTQIGYVASSPNTVLPNTLSNTEIHSLFDNMTKAVIIEKKAGTDFMFTYTAKLLKKAKKEVNKINFKLIGGITTYPGKTKLINDLKSSSRKIKLIVLDGKIIAKYQNDIAGRVVGKEEEMEILKQCIEDFPEVLADAFSVEKGAILCSVKLKENIETTHVKLDEAIEKIISRGINTKDDINEKLLYLRKNKVPSKAIAELFNSYVKYPNHIANRIPQKPKVLYVDTEGLVRDCVCYMNIGSNLLFEGDKGTGKNVLTETLAWLYNRPLYEFSSNSQHSNHSLLGGQTFENTKQDNKEERKKTSKSFFNTIKLFKKVFSKESQNIDIDESELSGIEKFLYKTLNKSDKDLVFEKSPILEAFEVGGIIVLDEFNTSLAHVMPIFNALLDDRRRMDITNYGLALGHPNFCAIATQNRDYEGTFEGNEATMDRFEPIIFPALTSIEGVLKERVPNISYDTLVTANKLYLKMKTAVEIGEIDEQALSIRGFVSACKVTEQGKPFKEALNTSVANRVRDLDDRKAVKNFIDLQLG